MGAIWSHRSADDCGPEYTKHDHIGAFSNIRLEDCDVPLCFVCASLDLEYNFKVGGMRVESPPPASKASLFGNFYDLIDRRECIFCRWLGQCLARCDPERFYQVSECWAYDLQLSFEREHDYDKRSWYTIGRLRIQMRDHTWTDVAELRSSPLAPPMRNEYDVRADYSSQIRDSKPGPIEPFEAKATLVRYWLSSCSTGHPKCMENSSKQNAPNATLQLIDVQKRQLVRRPFSQRYLALSYVWGAITQSAADGSGAIGTVPKTIEDAVTFTAALGFDYLWVDALCISNASHDSRLRDIRRMDQIYQHASAVLVAASGANANTGLSGISGSANQCSSFMFPTIIVYCRSLAESTPSLGILEPWNSRCWTLQEALFAKKCICFTEHEILFQCDSAIGRERLGHHFDVRGENEWLFKALRPGMEYIDPYTSRNTYHALVHRLLSRNLTYEYDIIHAFQGISNHIAAQNQDTPCWTCPRKFLLWGMTWCPLERSQWARAPLRFDGPESEALTHDVIRRRKAPHGECPFPSWFWGAWLVQNITYSDEFTRASRTNVTENWSQKRWQSIEKTGIIEMEGEVVNISLRSAQGQLPSENYLELGAEQRHWDAKSCSFISFPAWGIDGDNRVSALAISWKDDIAYRIGHIWMGIDRWRSAFPVRTMVKLG